MWGHYLLSLYRSLTRHWLYAALNVLGLAVGIAVFLVLWLDVRFETGFERWIPDARSIFVVRSIWQGEGLEANNFTMGGTIEELCGDYPQLTGARVWNQAATFRQGAQATSEEVAVVDPAFFKVFDLPLAAGAKAELLRTPDEVVLSQTEARRYFGAANPMGQRLTIVLQGAARTYRVSGVLRDPPRGTDLSLDVLIPLTPTLAASEPRWRHWGSEHLQTFLRFKTPAEARALDADLDAFVDRHAGHDLTPPAHQRLRLRTQPLVSLHLLDPKDAAVVVGLSAVGLLTLLLAGVNYVNLATARAGLRAREVALRRVMGATGPALFSQFMGEAIATALLAALIGLALCELALPLINAAGGLALSIDYARPDGVLVPILAATMAIGLGAGAYPALMLSRFRPATVLASARTPGGGRAGGRVREALVLLQFAIAIAFGIATGVIVSQTAYLRHADLGFRRDHLIVVHSFGSGQVTGAQRASLLAAWRSLPGVISVTTADIAPGNEDSTNATYMKRPGAPGDGPSVNIVRTQPEFFQTFGVRLVAGRLLDPDHGGDSAPAGSPTILSRPPRNVLANLNALPVLGFRDASDAIGKPILAGADEGGFNPLTIVGVVDNFRFRTPHAPIPPTVYFLETKDFENAAASVRYAAADPQEVLGRMKAQWSRIAPGAPFRAKTVEHSLQQYYQADDQHGRLFTLGAVLAVAIACVGLFGLASFSAARRVREIGIRKTLGASTGDILRVLVGQFLRPVLLANLIAWPLAYLAMRSWLSGFDQRIGLSPAYFFAASVLTLLIAASTVAGQAFAVARSEPAKALRHE
jgi:putative ABC transport system permease protein